MKKIVFIIILPLLISGCSSNISKCKSLYTLQEEGLCVQNMAVETGDINLCTKIENQDGYEGTKVHCIALVARKYKDVNLCNKIKDKNDKYGFSKIGCLEETGIAKYDVNICKMLEKEVDKAACIGGIARNKQDAKYCENISDTKFREDCKKSISGTGSGEIKSCDDWADIQVRNTCYSNLAVKNNDQTICEKVDGANNKDLCLQYVAENLKDVNLCGKIVNDLIKKKCENSINKK